MRSSIQICLAVAALALNGTAAFSSTSSQTQQTQTATCLSAQAPGRRAFLSSVVTTAVGVALASPALADTANVDDLSMPAAAAKEPQTNEAAAMAAKLERKAELQKKASPSRTFGESFKGEMNKQGELKKQTKEERRDAMCEELGRGC